MVVEVDNMQTTHRALEETNASTTMATIGVGEVKSADLVLCRGGVM